MSLISPASAVAAGAPEPAPAPLVLIWQRRTTPLEAIERALYTLADELSGVASEAGEEWRVLVHPRSASADTDRLAHRMRQEVTDQTLRVRIAERTDPIRNLVFALAFSRSGLTGADGARDVETGRP